MSVSAAPVPPRPIRWIVAASIVAVSGALAGILTGQWTAPLASLQTVAWLLAGLAVYAWTLDSLTWSVCLSVVVIVALLWAWAVRQASLLGWDVGAFSLLLAVSSMERLRRSRRRVRLQQALEDLREAQTEREQAIAAATQAREGLEKKLSRYQQLQAVAERLSAMTDATAIAQFAVDQAFALIGKSDACSLFVLEMEAQELSLVASKKRDAALTLRAKHGDQFDRHVLRTHKPLLVNDVRRDFRFTAHVADDRPIASVIACPLLLGERPDGVLRLDSASPASYTQDDLRLLDILLDLVATAMTNARLFAQVQRLAVTDGLTGLLLRRPWLEHLTRELLRAGRSREPLSILMLDVDHFKRYNDTYGHVAGDAILRSLGEWLRTAVPPGGFAARYGGEEFAVLLPGSARHQAVEVAERLRATVERETDTSTGQRGKERPRVTISIGIAAFPDDAPAELELIRLADQRLYQAKAAGRNRVCAA